MIEKIKISILYVEDDNYTRDELTDVLRFEIEDVDSTFDGEDAFIKMVQKKYDLLITDIRMPKIDGLALSQKVKELYPEMPIIITSAFNDTKYLNMAIDIGIDKYVTKPIDPEKLFDAINKIAENIFNKRDKEKYLEDLKKSNRIHKDLSRKLKNALRIQKNFVATVSHEIRTPLNSIVGFIELLNHTPLNEKQKEYGKNALLSSTHLLSLVNDVLDVSKLEVNQIELSHEEFDINELLKECGIIVSGRLDKNVSLDMNFPSSDYLVIGDPVRIKQIAINLLSNASKFTKQGKIEFLLKEFKLVDSETIYVEFCVEDTGIGIPKDKLEDIFEPFSQAHSSHFGGTGLGLYLSKSMAKLMKGNIVITSKEGEYTKASVSLSLKKGSLKIEHISKSSANIKDKKENLSDLKILIVDDVALNLMLAKEVFKHHYQNIVDTADSAKNAQKLIKQNSYDLMFLDIKMPEINGFELTKILREEGSQLPIYAMTANVYSDDVEYAKEIGMNGYLTKPIDPKEIKIILEQYIK